MPAPQETTPITNPVTTPENQITPVTIDAEPTKEEIQQQYDTLKAEQQKAQDFLASIGYKEGEVFRPLSIGAISEDTLGMTVDEAFDLYTDLIPQNGLQSLKDKIAELEPKLEKLLTPEELIAQGAEKIQKSFEGKSEAEKDKITSTLIAELQLEIAQLRVMIGNGAQIRPDTAGAIEGETDYQPTTDPVQQALDGDWSDPVYRKQVTDAYLEEQNNMVGGVIDEIAAVLPTKNIVKKGLRRLRRKESIDIEANLLKPSKWGELMGRFGRAEGANPKEKIDNLVLKLKPADISTMIFLLKAAEKMGLASISDLVPDTFVNQVNNEDVEALYTLDLGAEKTVLTLRGKQKVERKCRRPLLLWLTIHADIIKRSPFAKEFVAPVVVAPATPDVAPVIADQPVQRVLGAPPTDTAQTQAIDTTPPTQVEPVVIPEAKAEDLMIDEIIEFIKDKNPALLTDLSSLDISPSSSKLKIKMAELSVANPDVIKEAKDLSADVSYLIKAIQEKPSDYQTAFKNLQKIIFNLSKKE